MPYRGYVDDCNNGVSTIPPDLYIALISYTLSVSLLRETQDLISGYMYIKLGSLDLT